MTTDREAMQMVLEALEPSMSFAPRKIKEAINALRARLAQPDPLPPPPECQTVAEKNAYAFGWWKALETVRLEQPDLARVGEVGVWGEPVAMRWDFDGYGYRYIDAGSGSNWQTRVKGAEPLYTHPPTPVIDKSAAKRIATQLGWEPKREWQGLTDEEYAELWGKKPDLLNFFRKIEAKLKERNT